MAWVKTFRIHPDSGVPDKDIAAWLTVCEEKAKDGIRIHVQLLPQMGRWDPRLTIIVTKDILDADPN